MSESADDDERSLPVLYEDGAIIAVEKPTGMFVHRSDADRSATQFVLQCVRNQTDTFVYPVHRLDRATSGIVLLAKTRDVAAAAGRMFADRQVSKTYHALVRGHCESSGVVDIPLIPSRGRDKPAGHPFRETQDALTEYRTLVRYEVPQISDRYPTTRCSLMEIKPVTGRYHQIRRHFNYIAHPVIGDTAHGDTRQNRFFQNAFAARRLMLAAVQMRLPHPVSGEILQIDCPPAESFTSVLQRLNTWRCPDRAHG